MGVLGLGCRELRVQGVKGLGGLGFRVRSLGFRVWSLRV